MITAEDKLREIERELKMRRRHYQRWIDEGKIHVGEAKRQIDILAAIAEDYEWQAKSERLL